MKSKETDKRKRQCKATDRKTRGTKPNVGQKNVEVGTKVSPFSCKSTFGFLCVVTVHSVICGMFLSLQKCLWPLTWAVLQQCNDESCSSCRCCLASLVLQFECFLGEYSENSAHSVLHPLYETPRKARTVESVSFHVTLFSGVASKATKIFMGLARTVGGSRQAHETRTCAVSYQQWHHHSRYIDGKQTEGAHQLSGYEILLQHQDDLQVSLYQKCDWLQRSGWIGLFFPCDNFLAVLHKNFTPPCPWESCLVGSFWMIIYHPSWSGWNADHISLFQTCISCHRNERE